MPSFLSNSYSSFKTQLKAASSSGKLSLTGESMAHSLVPCCNLKLLVNCPPPPDGSVSSGGIRTGFRIALPSTAQCGQCTDHLMNEGRTDGCPGPPPGYRAFALSMPPRMNASVNAGSFNADINLQYETGFLKITAHFSFFFIVFFFSFCTAYFSGAAPGPAVGKSPPRPTLRTGFWGPLRTPRPEQDGGGTRWF